MAEAEAGWQKYFGAACREQSLIERQAREKKKARLIRVATYDDQVTLAALSERFGWPPSTIAQMLREAGVNADRRDDFGSDWRRWHRRTRREREQEAAHG
jgi:hypothetical protein